MKLKAIAAALILAAPVFAHAAPVTLFAGKNVTLEQGTVVNGNVAAGGNVKGNYQTAINGNVQSQGSVSLEQLAKVQGNVAAGGKVTLNTQSSVGGKVATSATGNVAVSMEQNAKVGGTVSHNSGTRLTTSIGAQHGGDVITNVAAPSLDTLPGATAFATGTTAYNLNAYGNGVLGQGKYGSVNIGYDSTLKLTAGNYYFDSLNVSSDSKFIFDLSGGAINLFIKGNVSIGQYFDFETLGGSYSDIYTETKGNWSQGGYGEWYGTLFGSGAGSNLHFSQNSTIGGTFMARNNIQLDINTIVTGMPEQANEGAEIPLPGSLALLGLGLLALGLIRRRNPG